MLGFHLLPGSDAEQLRWAATPGRWIKVCDAALIGPAQAAGCKVYYRPYLPDDGNCPDGAAWADACDRAMADAAAPLPDAIVYRNEIAGDLPGQVREYLRWRDALRSHGYHGLCVYGSFGVGEPGLGEWGPIWSAFGGERPDALDLHEYWDMTVTGSQPWYALRHRLLLLRSLIPSDLPLFIGECGSDRLGIEDGQKRGGWNDAGKLSADAEAANVASYGGQCALSVVAAFVFADGGAAGNEWGAYATRGSAVEAAIRGSVRPDAAPVPTVSQGGGSAVSSYCTQLDSSGSGGERCGAACVASVLLDAGWQSDPWGLTEEVAGKIPGIEQYGANAEQLIAVAQSYGFKARAWDAWDDAVQCLRDGKAVLCECDNWMLRPRNYPAGAAWDALHWVRLRLVLDDRYAVIYDPLTYLQGEYPVPYQGPTCVAIQSLRAAIAATPVADAGVVIWR